MVGGVKATFIALLAFSLCLPILAQDKLKPISLRKPKASVVGMMAWEGKKRVFLEIKVPGREATPIYHALMESESANGFKVLSIDPGKGEVKLDIKGQVVSSVVPGWPVAPKANPPKKGFVTLSFSRAPLEIVLDVFGGLSGRSIIAASNLPRVFFNLKPKAPMSKADCLTVLIGMVTSKAGDIRPLGNKFAQVEPPPPPCGGRPPPQDFAYFIKFTRGIRILCVGAGDLWRSL